MRPLRAVIVDDEPLAVRGLELSLSEIPGVVIAGTASDGKSGLELIRAKRPDLVLLDIQMPLADGMEVARALAEAEAPAVIFVTAFGQFALEAFEVAAIDYLLKPVSPERLRAAVDRARARLAASTVESRRRDLEQVVQTLNPAAPAVEPSVWVSGARGRFRLPLGVIDWLEAERDYVRIHTTRGESYIERGTLGELTEALGEAPFQRVHRSASVNLNHVKGLVRRRWGMTAVALHSGREIPVGRSHLPALKARLEEGCVVTFRKRTAG